MLIQEIEERLNKEIGILVYFSGESCSVCHVLRPKIQKLFDEKFPKIKQIFLDAKENAQIASHFGVFSVPTLIVFLEGKEFVREGRSLSLYQLEEKIMRPYEMMTS